MVISVVVGTERTVGVTAVIIGPVAVITGFVTSAGCSSGTVTVGILDDTVSTERPGTVVGTEIGSGAVTVITGFGSFYDRISTVSHQYLTGTGSLVGRSGDRIERYGREGVGACGGVGVSGRDLWPEVLIAVSSLYELDIYPIYDRGICLVQRNVQRRLA